MCVIDRRHKGACGNCKQIAPRLSLDIYRASNGICGGERHYARPNTTTRTSAAGILTRGELMKNLKPCPFCGNKNIYAGVTERRTWYESHVVNSRVEFSPDFTTEVNCSCGIGYKEKGLTSLAAIIAKWNRRAWSYADVKEKWTSCVRWANSPSRTRRQAITRRPSL